MNHENTKRITNSSIAEEVAYSEKEHRDKAAQISTQIAGLQGVGKLLKRRELRDQHKEHVQKAESAGNLKLREIAEQEERNRVSSLDREQLTSTLLEKANTLTKGLSGSAGEWAGIRDTSEPFLKWSANETTGHRTVTFHTAEKLEPGMTMNRYLVLTEAEEPQLWFALDDRGNQSGLQRSTGDLDYKINQALVTAIQTADTYIDLQDSAK